MSSEKSKTAVYLKDYQPFGFEVIQMALTLDLALDKTRVQSRLELERNPKSPDPLAPLVLNGRQLTLLTIQMDGHPLPPERYTVTPEHLSIPHCPDRVCLEMEVEINPQENSALEGLYASGSMLCSQCEAEGFQKITYYPDRPDVMAPFSTRLIADAHQFPILLSNGNLVDSGPLENGKQFALWQDPFKKPAYLFAVVAGNLVCRQDTFTTRSGRVVDLRVYVEEQNKDKCAHALHSLKKAMAWDERTYGREYDLDVYMIVAVDDFNMGAMENKGLNLFNAKYVLAHPETATDADYHLIEAVIGHEYFHNWTGNRITCRDWFQLSLKEGLTVFREQEFSGESLSADIQRIQDVTLLRNHQFPEDAGPTAHPVQPPSFLEINNFYTMTVYEKGAELVGMIRTLLGADAFRQGMDLYFARHDGQAVTIHEWIAAMEQVSQRDFSQFKRWYEQAGTPILTVSGHYDPEQQCYQLTIEQDCPPTPGQKEKKPFHMPITMGLLNPSGEELPLILAGEAEPKQPVTERVLELTEKKELFTFTHITSPPIPSLLRRFSAPVRLKADLTDDTLAFLWSRDTDAFNRWEGGQELATRLLLTLIEADQPPEQTAPDRVDLFVTAFARTLTDEQLAPAPRALTLTLPSEKTLLDRMGNADPQRIHTVREWLRQTLAIRLQATFHRLFETFSDTSPYRFTAEEAGRRSLRNLCLAYLLCGGETTYRSVALDHFYRADNMTDRLGALAPLSTLGCAEGDEAMAAFEKQWQRDPLVMDKWFSLHAMAPLPDTLATVTKLMNHPLFTLKNPNRVRALIGAFCHSNPYCFHAISGEGYRFFAEQVLTLNSRNPQIAARLLTAMNAWRHIEPARRSLMKETLDHIAQSKTLSRDVYEIVTKLQGDKDNSQEVD